MSLTEGVGHGPVYYTSHELIEARQVHNISDKIYSTGLYLLWGGVRGTTILFNKNVVAVVAGVSYGAAYALDKVMKVPEFLFRIGAVNAAAQTLDPMGREMIGEGIRRAQQRSDAAGQLVQAGADTAQWLTRGVKILVSGVPFAAGAMEVASVGIDAYQGTDALVRAAGREHLGVVSTINSYFITFASKLLPGTWWLMSKGTEVAGSLTSWASDRTYELWTNPEAPQQRMLNISDRLHSESTRLWGCFEAVHVPGAVAKETFNFTAEVSEDETIAFNAKTKEELQDLLYLISNPPQDFPLTKADMQSYQEALKNLIENNNDLEDTTKIALINIEKSLPPQLTPLLFQKFDELIQLKLLNVVFNHAALTPTEREFLLRPEFRDVSRRGDLLHLDPVLRKKLDAILISKFNTLNPDDRKLVLRLSIEQFKELSKNSQKKLIDKVSDKAVSAADKKILDDLRKHHPLTEHRHIRALLKLFNKHYKGDENLAVLAKLTEETEQIILCPTSKTEIDTMIQSLKVKIDESTLDHEKLELGAVITWLESQKALFEKFQPPEMLARPKEKEAPPLEKPMPIDTAQIDEKIGMYVGLGQTVGERYVGRVARYLPWGGGFLLGPAAGLSVIGLGAAAAGVGYIMSPHGIELPEGSWMREHLKPLTVEQDGKVYLLGSLKCATFQDWVSITIGKATTVAEIALLLPFVSDFVITKLGQMGIPVDAAEEMLRLFPTAAYSLFWTFVRSIPPAISTMTRPITFMSENINIVRDFKTGQQTLIDLASNRTIDDQKLTSLYNNLEAAFDRVCECLPGGSGPFVCEPQIVDTLKSANFWENMAKDYQLPPESSALYKAVIDNLERRKIPMPEFTPQEAARTLDEAASFLAQAKNLGTQAKENIYACFAYLYAKTIQGTQVEALGGLAKETIKATGIPDKIVGEAAKLGTAATYAAAEMSGKVGTMARELGRTLGYREAIPPDMLNILTAISQHYGEIAEKEALEKTAVLAIEAYKNLMANWYGRAVTLLAESPENRQLIERFMEYFVKPGETMANVAGTLAKIGEKSEQYLQTQLVREEVQPATAATYAFEQSFTLLQKGLSETAGASSKLGSVSGMATVGAMGTVLGTGLGLASGGYWMLPILLRYAVLPIIRHGAGPAARAGQSIFYNIAATYYETLDNTGKELQEACKTLGGTCQYAVNYLRPAMLGVNDTRIKNFLNLSNEEKKHLMEIAIASGNIKPEVRKVLQEHLNIEKYSKDEQYKIAQDTLLAYDRLATDEKLLISAQFFEQLEPAKQARIRDIVAKEVGLDANERRNTKAIVDKFNKLPVDLKKEIDIFSVWDYGMHSPDEQEDILFQIVNSQAYKTLKSTKTPSVSWTMEQFRAIKKMPMKELKKIISLYDSVTPTERNIITPSSLRAITTRARLCDLATTASTYNRQAVDALKKAYGPQYDLTKLEQVLKAIEREPHRILLKQRDTMLEALSIACNTLRPHQKPYLLLMSKNELGEMKKDQRMALITYLYGQPLDENIKLILKNELDEKPTEPGFIKSVFYSLVSKYITRITPPSNDELIVEVFNSLPVLVQADFRQESSRIEDTRLDAQKNARRDIQNESIKLNIVNQQIETYSSRLLGKQIILEATKDETLRKQQENEQRTLASLVANFNAKREAYESKITALSMLLPEEEQEAYKKTKGLTLPPEWMAYINAGTTIAVREMATLISTATDQFMKDLAGTSFDDKKQIAAGAAIVKQLLDCAVINREAVEKEVKKLFKESEEEDNPTERIVKLNKASYARDFLSKLKAKSEEEMRQVKEKYATAAKASLGRHEVTQERGTAMREIRTPKEDIDRIAAKLARQGKKSYLTSDSWHKIKNLRQAVGDTLIDDQQKLLSLADRQIVVSGLTLRKPPFEAKLKAFERLNIENQLLVLKTLLEQQPDFKADAYIRAFCDKLRASQKTTVYLDYLGLQTSPACQKLYQAYESSRKK